MNSTRNLGIISGAILVLFFFSFGSILLFGLFKETISEESIVLFKTLYFVFVFSILGIIYVLNSDLLNSWLEHSLIIFSIVVLSAGVATLAGELKVVHDHTQNFSFDEIAQMEATNNYYEQYVKTLAEREEEIIVNNILLEINVDSLSEKINNKTPIIVETIITLPPEIIYVDEETTEDYEDEEDEEDDDD
ncbi:MAG: hypothetical protein ACP5N2_07265 [Candidatus Nanoarchaeia archaeon]